MYWSDCFDRFQLHDHCLLHYEIGAECLGEEPAIIRYRDGLLPHDRESTLFQFMGEDRLIHGFEEPRPKGDMDLERRINNLAGDFVLCHPLRLCLLCAFARNVHAD